VKHVTSSSQPGIHLIAGLGNPGVQYAHNRHNVGFHCLRRLAVAHGLEFKRRKKKAYIASGDVAGKPVVLAMPQNFMNESGRSGAPLVRFYKLPLERLLVVYDDLDLPQGTIRLRLEGGSGGHKGMASIIRELSSQNFPRLRIGIGRPPGQMDPADYVLQDFDSAEKPAIEDALERAAAAIETWLAEGIEEAMDRYNRRTSRIGKEVETQ
jgi:PTH1 family peptidyl-tRNA hydrolase